MKQCIVSITRENKIETTFFLKSDKHKAKRKLLGLDDLAYDTFNIDMIPKIVEECDKVQFIGLDNITDGATYKFGFDSVFELVKYISPMYTLLITNGITMSKLSKARFSITDCLDEEESMGNKLEYFSKLDIIMLYSFHMLYDYNKRATMFKNYTDKIKAEAEEILNEVMRTRGLLSTGDIDKIRKEFRSSTDEAEKHAYTLVKKYMKLTKTATDGVKLNKNPLEYLFGLDISYKDMNLIPKSTDYYFIHISIIGLYSCILGDMTYEQFKTKLDLDEEHLINKEYRMKKFLGSLRLVKEYTERKAGIKNRDNTLAQILVEIFDSGDKKILLSECNKSEIQLAIHSTLDIHSALTVIDKAFTSRGYGAHLEHIAVFNGIINSKYLFDTNNKHNIKMSNVRKCEKHIRFNGISDEEIEAYKISIENNERQE